MSIVYDVYELDLSFYISLQADKLIYEFEFEYLYLYLWFKIQESRRRQFRTRTPMATARIADRRLQTARLISATVITRLVLYMT